MKKMNRLALRHIVCPVDFTGPFRLPLAYAMAMARARNAELRALHVVSGESVAAAEGPGSVERHNLMQRLRAALTEAGPDHDLVGSAVRDGDPATQILHFARAMSADLIVMGSPGANKPERPVGPVASVVIARSDCPVLTVPAHRAAPPDESGVFSRIVCGIDLTPSSRSVIRQALSLAWESGGRLAYVCAVPENSANSPLQARDTLTRAIPPEAGQWCEVDIIVTKGAGRAEIVRVADQDDADLVVIGPPRRWMSTTHTVLGHSRCPVLVTHDGRPLPWPTAPMARDSGIAAGMNRSRS
jgi:nucleotide-binding universal stress UspA family protein